MRKMLSLVLCALLLAPRASAAELSGYLALTFEELPGAYWEELLEGLAEREVKATFFLTVRQLEENPRLGERILSGGHEVGLRGFTAGDPAALSRRQMAQELAKGRSLLPEKARPRFLRLDRNGAPAQVRQVARARGLALLGWSGAFRDPGAGDASAAGQSALSRVRDGDILILSAGTRQALEAALNTADLLRKRGFRLVTVSELVRFRGLRVTAGAFYSSFPPKEP